MRTKGTRWLFGPCLGLRLALRDADRVGEEPDGEEDDVDGDESENEAEELCVRDDLRMRE